jgi:predicted permease
VLQRIRSWLLAAVWRTRLERDMADEVEFHVEARARDLLRSGLSQDEARRRARLEFGAPERYKEECRESRGLRVLDEFRADALYALRGIRRSPGFSAVVVLSLALGIGANTAMFSIVNGVLLRPLPFRDQDRLVWLGEEMPQSLSTLKAFRPSLPVNFWMHRDEFSSFEDMIAMDYAVYQLIDVPEPEELEAVWVTSNMCAFLGVQPVIGRCFTAEEERGRAQVALLSHSLWQRQFSGDPKVVGRAVAFKDYLGDKTVTVIGILPPQVRLRWNVDMWMPLSESPNYRRRDSWWSPSLTIARLKRGVDIRQARAELLSAQKRMLPGNYEGAGGREIRVLGLPDYLAQSIKPGLQVLVGVVALVLLITCANVANLLLSRGAGRLREIAVRASLGAGRIRICRQMLTEAATLALLGGAIGLAIANWMMKGVKALAMERLPRVDDIHMDWTVLGFTAVVSLVSGILFGLLPALRLSRLDLADAMKAGGAGAIGGRRHQRLMNGLVMLEIALCVIAMMGAGLLINTFIRLKSVDPGFRGDRVLVASLRPRPGLEAATRLSGEMLQRVRSMPGVEEAGLTNYFPLLRVRSIRDFRIPGTSVASAAGSLRANSRVASPGYFRALGIPILRGRPFEETDHENSPRVIVVSEALAQRYWPGENPLGQVVLLSEGPRQSPAEIVGVARDVRQTGLRDQLDDMIYFNYTQTADGVQALIVRTRGDPAKMAAAVKSEVRSIDRNQTFRRLTTMSELLAGEFAEPRFYMVLLAAYGALALALTTIGVGGLVAYSVNRRTQEIGLRISFGATSSGLLRMFSAGVLKLAIAGLVVGIPSSVAVTRLMRGLLYGVEATDPATFAAVAVAIVAVSLAACGSAAFRATRVDPSIVLRHE